MSDDSVKEIVDGIPEDQRGAVWHALGQALREKGGGAHTDGGPTIEPTPPPKPKL